MCPCEAAEAHDEPPSSQDKRDPDMLIPIGSFSPAVLSSIMEGFYKILWGVCENLPIEDAPYGPILHDNENPRSLEYIFEEYVDGKSRISLKIRFGSVLIDKYNGPVSLSVDTRIDAIPDSSNVQVSFICKLNFTGSSVSDLEEMSLIGESVRVMGKVLSQVEEIVLSVPKAQA